MKVFSILLFTLNFSLNLNAADACEGKRYTKLAKEVFVNEACPNFIMPNYNGSVFNGMWNGVEKVYKKYCENTPEVICETEIVQDINVALLRGLNYESNNEDLFQLFDIKKMLNTLTDYAVKSSGYPSVSLDRVIPREIAPATELSLRYAGQDDHGDVFGVRDIIKYSDIDACNANLKANENLTCRGKMGMALNLYYSLKSLHDRTALSLMSYCLERKQNQLERGEDIGSTPDSFGPCDADLKQFE